MLEASLSVRLYRQILHRKFLPPRPSDDGLWNENVLFIWERDG